jgi:hypothetical protein
VLPTANSEGADGGVSPGLWLVSASARLRADAWTCLEISAITHTEVKATSCASEKTMVRFGKRGCAPLDIIFTFNTNRTDGLPKRACKFHCVNVVDPRAICRRRLQWRGKEENKAEVRGQGVGK